MIKLKKRKPNRSRWGDFFVYLVLLVFGWFFILPLVYAVNSAFKPLDEIFLFPPKLWVGKPTLDNFADLFVLMGKTWVPFSRYIFNTVFITVVGTLGHLIVASMAAYVLSKYRFPGSKLFFTIVVSALMFTPQVMAIPNYLVMTKLGWVNTYWAIIVPAFAAPIGLFLMKQFMEQIPDVLIEAAKVDGAKEVRIFIKIILPLVKPASLTLSIFSILNLWNTRASNFIYDEELKTLPYALSQVVTGGIIARAGVSAAVTLFILIVPLLFFILAQSSIIETMASSGIKE
ncbi:carbohydrate ABC transporter permease [Herbinix luporum]|jgi:ABC-type glycerol-3-phosphate transport system permease component|uniref:Putative membrane protein n=1 Tax=Herbinix luporum TaxID=1679721 RepID=A0A0K8J2D5_9FIRM|nr:carbohydrate ABC transporter permease [Herbinix luporum]MDI9487910.1 carbohydrate ABC transporter permease [Bacillota bacterium]CUH91811.1 putative membrane protein [Herbinix luporum]HHT56873.1 carbohydrate ABC transporter permease [Herbinix luporum]